MSFESALKSLFGPKTSFYEDFREMKKTEAWDILMKAIDASNQQLSKLDEQIASQKELLKGWKMKSPEKVQHQTALEQLQRKRETVQKELNGEIERALGSLKISSDEIRQKMDALRSR